MNQFDPLLNADFVVLDTETTGLFNDAEICEISVINKFGDVLLDTLVKPINPIPADATAIHGITNDMVKHAPHMHDVFPLLQKVIKDKTLVIYNSEYDSRIIYQSVQYYGEFSKLACKDLFCAMLAYSEFYGQYDNYRQNYKWQKLTNACFQQGLPVDPNAHRSLADCNMTLSLIRKCLELS